MRFKPPALSAITLCNSPEPWMPRGKGLNMSRAWNWQRTSTSTSIGNYWKEKILKWWFHLQTPRKTWRRAKLSQSLTRMVMNQKILRERIHWQHANCASFAFRNWKLAEKVSAPGMSSVCFSPPSQHNGVLPALSSNVVSAPETHSCCSFNNSWGLELPHLLWGGATHASAASLFVQHMTHTFVSTCFQIAICRLWGTFQGESTMHNLSCSLWPQAFLAMFSKSKFVSERNDSDRPDKRLRRNASEVWKNRHPQNFLRILRIFTR